MKHKIHKYCTLTGVLLLLLTLSGCMKEVIDVLDKEKYTNLYIPQASQSPNLKNIFMREAEQTLSLSVFYGGVDNPSHDVKVSVAFAPELAAAYNAEKGTNYEVMPEGSYTFDTREAVITSGQPQSSLITMKVKSQGYINAFTQYLLPVRIESVSDGTALHPKMSTIYFVISGSYEPGKIPTEKVLQLEGGKLTSIFKYYNNLITQSQAGAIRLYPYQPNEDQFGSGSIINTGWDAFDWVMPFADRWIVRWGSWTGGNNGFLNSYSVSQNGTINGLVSGWFSGGFQAFDLIVPYQGNLLCRLPGGEIRRYPIDNNYNFGASSSLGTGWHSFTQIIPYKNTLLCIDAAGDMWEYPVTAGGSVSPRRQVGSGWYMYSRIVSFGDDLLAIDDSNAVYQYKFNPIGFWALK